MAGISKGLRPRVDYLAVQGSGTKLHGRHVLAIARRREDARQCGRLGLTVTKNVGNAVVRNRIKRLVRGSLLGPWSFTVRMRMERRFFTATARRIVIPRAGGNSAANATLGTAKKPCTYNLIITAASWGVVVKTRSAR